MERIIIQNITADKIHEAMEIISPMIIIFFMNLMSPAIW